MIFVSYSWKDREVTEVLLESFKERGIQYWVDSDRLDLSQSLKPQIQAALSRASAVVYLDTLASRNSSWVGFELYQARVRSVPVISVRQPKSPSDITGRYII